MKFSTFVQCSIGTAVLFLTACQSTKQSAPQADILATHIDSTCAPSDDFFQFANGRWLKENPIPASESGWGIANLVNEELYKRKLNINEQAVAAKDKNKTQQQLANFWTCAMDSNKAEQLGLTPLSPLLTQIQKAKNIEEVLILAAQLHRIGVGVFFSEGVGQDEMNSSKMCYQIHQGGLGMPNRDYYFNQDARTQKIREQYPKYIQKIFELNGEETALAAQNATAVMSFETALAAASRKLEALRDPYKNYNKMHLDAFKKSTNNIPWLKLIQTIGIEQIDTVIIGQPEFFTTLNHLLKQTPLSSLKSYLSFHLINDYAAYLSPALENASFDFYGKTISGKQAMKPRWKRVLGAEENAIGEILGQLFVKEYFNEKAKKRYEDLTEAVRAAYKNRIEQLTWMSDSTKQKALNKLATMTKKVGYPDKWKDFSSLEIDTLSYAANMMKANEWWNQYSIHKLNKPVDRTEWDMTPQTYNAYYNPSNNEIVLPAGIFTVPGFRDEELDDALVYGYAGASTIGHEITHGFDDQGRQFDAFGNLKNWWSKDDEQQFNTRAAMLVKQFDNMIVLDSLHINGKATLGENLADLGGILIALDAFKLSDAYKSQKSIAGYTPLQRYFLGYSLGWLYQERPEQLASQLLTDVHAPAKQRVNGPFPNVPDFYTAFKINPGTKMYLPDSLRVKLW